MAAAFQVSAFQNNAFQIDAGFETSVFRGGFDLREIDKYKRIDRARSQAREAARKAARELRQTLEHAFDDNTATAEVAAAIEPEIRRSIAAAQAELANVLQLEPLGSDIRKLRYGLMQLIAAEYFSRLSITQAAKQAELIHAAHLDEEAAIVTLLI